MACLGSPMPPKKGAAIAAWVTSTPAPFKAKVPKVSYLNKLTSSDWKGIVATVDERIEWCQFETLVTKNFSSWEDVRKHLGVEPEVIVRLQDRLAEHPSVLKWVQKPGEFASDPSQPDILPPESAASPASRSENKSRASMTRRWTSTKRRNTRRIRRHRQSAVSS